MLLKYNFIISYLSLYLVIVYSIIFFLRGLLEAEEKASVREGVRSEETSGSCLHYLFKLLLQTVL